MVCLILRMTSQRENQKGKLLNMIALWGLGGRDWVSSSLFFLNESLSFSRSLYSWKSKCRSHGEHSADQRFPTLDNQKHLCGSNDCVYVCNQPQGTDWILPARDGDALQCNGCGAGFPKSQSPRIRRGNERETGHPDGLYWFMIALILTTLTSWLL